MHALSATPWLAVLGLVTSLGLPSVAFADEVVIPPLVPRGSTQVRDVSNVTQLLASEMDFMREVERVIELSKVPTGFGLSCLDKSGCLRTIGQAEGGTHVLAGSLRVADTQVELDLVYFAVGSGRYVRRQSFQMPNRPEVIADSMGDIAREMVTGEAPKTDASADDELDLLDFDDDFEVDFDKSDFAEAQASEADARRRAEEENRRRAAEDARREAEAQARREAEEAARRKAQEEARRRAEAERIRAEEEEARRRAAAEDARRREAEAEARRAAAAAPEPEPEDEFDPNAISFGSAAIVVEDPDGGSSRVEPQIVTSEPESLDYYGDDEPDLYDEPAIADLDDLDDDEPDEEPVRVKEVREKPAREKATRPPKSKSKGAGGGFDDEPTAIGIAVRGGYSPYYSLGFVTVGGELSIAAGDTGVQVLAGFQTWSVQRDIPVEFQRLAGATTEWNTLFPVNVGAVYKVSVADGRVKPYGGADLLFARYYVGESSGLGSIAVGARARAGVDVMVVRNFGLTADVAIGGWGGGDWVIIEEGVKNAGVLPQFSAGTVIAF